MNSKLAKLMSTVLIATTLLAILPVFADVEPPPSMYLDPDTFAFMTGTTPLGTTFDVTAYENCLDAQFTWQVMLYYNTAQLNITAVTYTGPGGSKSLWAGALGSVTVTPVIDYVAGSIKCGESLLGGNVTGGPYSLVRFTFVIIAGPPKGGNLASVLSISNADTYLLNPDLLDILPLNKINADYSYGWSAPPSPHLAVAPNALDFGPYPPSAVGMTFDETVTLMGLDANWYCHQVVFDLTYVPTLLQVNGVVVDPLWTVSVVDTTVPGVIHIDVSAPSSNPGGNVLIATITFEILMQAEVPPSPSGYHDDSPLTIINAHAYDTTIEIPLLAPTNGLIRVFAIQAIPSPYLVVSDAAMGPTPVVGQHFNVTVTLTDLAWQWYLEGIQFRLKWPEDLIWPVAVYEGPFLTGFSGFPNNGTYFISYIENDPLWGWDVVVGDMIVPDDTGIWHEPWVGGTGVVAIIEFVVTYQSWGYPELSGQICVVEQLAIGLSDPVLQDVIEVPLADPVCGTYTITTNLYGRMLDVYGGAVNSNLIEPDWQQIWQFVPPYGGQGLNMPMDLVEPQSWVWLHANVTYNYWPIQHKLVAFEIIMPNGELYANLFAFTDANGVATVGFRMPWPCDNPESLFGVWWVISTVQVADEVIRDDLWFHYDYIVNINKITTDKYQYAHGETVLITVEFTSHAQQCYEVLIKCAIMDNLGVVIGECRQFTEIGGAVFCQPKSYLVRCEIPIPKWAYVGLATIHVNAFSDEPVYGGVPLGPEFTTNIEITPF